MRVLVTGACGFVAPYLIQELQLHGHEVVGTHHRDTAPLLDIPLERCDITDPTACLSVFQKYQPETIFNLAGITHVSFAQDHPSETYQVNVEGFKNLLRISENDGVRRHYVCISSSEVYDADQATGNFIDESCGLTDRNVYASSKIQAENAVQVFSHLPNITYTIFRPFNHIGPGQSDQFVASRFAKKFAIYAKGDHRPITVGNLDAERDFTDVRDIVRGYVLGMELKNETLNLCSGHFIPIGHLIDLLREISGLQPEIQVESALQRQADARKLPGSNQLAKELIKWSPQISLEQTMTDLYNYWLKEID